MSKDILAKAVVTVIVMIAFAVLFDRPHRDLQPFINPPDILTSHRSGAIPLQHRRGLVVRRDPDEIAAEVAKACADRDEISPSLEDFIADHTRATRVR